ncbi:Presequence translocated-associated motor subunit PAM17, mitochondrial [Trametes pubescens]|uniref:Presequence translocated-associated motor subunit PAM17 n=1 Tax=Trametes pubescens TaxID=154538 RepID=A0A1M2VTK1_TRAPU|nr:Presequence translocated-associated motor subunit PAM17, mitochondrial [Trametes pubescens]
MSTLSQPHLRTFVRGLPRSCREDARTRTQLLSTTRAKSTKATKTRTQASKAPNTSASSAQPSQAEKETLPWQEYLSIRKQKRRWETNIDPMFVYGGATLGCAGLGYLLGPVIGSSIWRLTHRRLMKLIEQRDKEFHQHIVKNRVDPTAQSATNPVPDYYGEKIGSLHAYRQWLRDQAKFRKKASGFLAED